MAKAKPFIKWVGGKNQLIEQLEALLPADFDNWQNVTYVEPFVGGGAMLFHLLQTRKNIKRAIINDINGKLTTCYKVIKENPQALIERLESTQKFYYSLPTEEAKKSVYLNYRDRFNSEGLDDLEVTALFIILNRTCFNGLFRENKSGQFNVPFGKYEKPLICDKANILAVSRMLQNVEILTGDFEETLNQIDGHAFFYFDPPYRPLSNTSSFNSYTKEDFNDNAQVRLKVFCDRLNSLGHHFMLSNSDCFSKDGDCFFEKLYRDYSIERVWASRNINADASKRGKLTEIVVRNYTKPTIVIPPLIYHTTYETII